MTRAFQIDAAMEAVREAVRPYPPAALFALADAGFRTPFQQLAACILSIRTLDEVSLPIARDLLSVAPDPRALLTLGQEALEARIRGVAFHELKARQLLEIARLLMERHAGVLPCDPDLLVSLPGVGDKCAGLVLGIACGRPRIAVDTHVHRIANRWGYVRARDPAGTLAALEAKLPRRYWVELNRVLVPFGKHVCTPRLPRCSTCPVRPMCARVDVERSR